MIQTIAIDVDSFHNELKNKSLTQFNVSIGLGHSKSYLSKYISRGLIPERDIDKLKNIYGISYDMYKKKELEKTDDQQLPIEGKEEVIIDYNKLGKVILDNVMVAVINALKSLEIDRLPDMVLEHQNELFVQSGLMEKDEILSLFSDRPHGIR